MKKFIIEKFNMKFKCSTKHNEIWESEEYVMIVHKISHLIKIKMK